ncbi:origin of replication complex subunit 4 isoform X2 [Beta vulgaris subsp. vulgaris]|uniref:origin of replication complex subunit 4 isoform X2 n=1 Tax=Beta vulgaris subsp. vulgaris TaxID=3555 RepID=UPI002036C277|nr:origin of replication complex subunit 4 isoform X2 [Beta vulgaris subsp. vulgaris]
MEETPAEEALILLRSRLCDPHAVFSLLSASSDSNYSKLKFIISSSIAEACNNSVLLLGPRGCGKTAVLQLVLNNLLAEYPDMISVCWAEVSASNLLQIRLNGLLHSDDNCALKEIARQLCAEHQLLFSKMASFDDNTQFVIGMLRECGLAHKTIVFILDEFDLFAQGKQRLLYSLLDAMQSVTSQAVVIGISCKLDADQLLEKRVRSRLSHRKLLFCPPSIDEMDRLLECVLSLPENSSLPQSYVVEYNNELRILADKKFKDTMTTLLSSDSTVDQILRFLFLSVSTMDMKRGILSVENFNMAVVKLNRQPKLEFLKDCSVLELYILVCMKRLEVKEQNSYNFNSVMKEYKAIHDSFQTPDYYARKVCLRAFQHLIQCELICFMDNRGYNQSIEYRPVKILISSYELHQGLKLNQKCPSILQKLMDQTGKKS